MINFKKLFSMRIVSLVVAVTFFVTSTSYGIDIPDRSHLRTPLLTNSDQGTSRLKQALFYQLRQMLGQVVNADTSKDLAFYEGEKQALLLEDGKILVNEELYDKYNSEIPGERTEALQVLIHETVEALLQVVKRNHSSRYQTMKELALSNLPALYFRIPHQADKTYRDEILANDIWAVAFEYRMMGITPEQVQDPDLQNFLKKSYEIIDARRSLFGEEFNSPYRAKETVVEALRRGFEFKRVARADAQEEMKGGKEVVFLQASVADDLIYPEGKSGLMNSVEELKGKPIRFDIINGEILLQDEQPLFRLLGLETSHSQQDFLEYGLCALIRERLLETDVSTLGDLRNLSFVFGDEDSASVSGFDFRSPYAKSGRNGIFFINVKALAALEKPQDRQTAFILGVSHMISHEALKGADTVEPILLAQDIRLATTPGRISMDPSAFIENFRATVRLDSGPYEGILRFLDTGYLRRENIEILASSGIMRDLFQALPELDALYAARYKGKSFLSKEERTAVFQYATILVHQGRIKEAREVIEQPLGRTAILGSSYDKELYKAELQYYLNMGDIVSAVTLTEKFFAEFPDDWRVTNGSFVKEFVSRGYFQQARELLKKYYQGDEIRPGGELQHIAFLYKELGEFNDLINICKLIPLQFKPEDRPREQYAMITSCILADMAIHLVEEGRMSEAIAIAYEPGLEPYRLVVLAKLVTFLLTSDRADYQAEAMNIVDKLKDDQIVSALVNKRISMWPDQPAYDYYYYAYMEGVYAEAMFAIGEYESLARKVIVTTSMDFNLDYILERIGYGEDLSRFIQTCVVVAAEVEPPQNNIYYHNRGQLHFNCRIARIMFDWVYEHGYRKTAEFIDSYLDDIEPDRTHPERPSWVIAKLTAQACLRREMDDSLVEECRGYENGEKILTSLAEQRKKRNEAFPADKEKKGIRRYWEDEYTRKFKQTTGSLDIRAAGYPSLQTLLERPVDPFSAKSNRFPNMTKECHGYVTRSSWILSRSVIGAVLERREGYDRLAEEIGPYRVQALLDSVIQRRGADAYFVFEGFIALFHAGITNVDMLDRIDLVLTPLARKAGVGIAKAYEDFVDLLSAGIPIEEGLKLIGTVVERESSEISVAYDSLYVLIREDIVNVLVQAGISQQEVVSFLQNIATGDRWDTSFIFWSLVALARSNLINGDSYPTIGHLYKELSSFQRGVRRFKSLFNRANGAVTEEHFKQFEERAKDIYNALEMQNIIRKGQVVKEEIEEFLGLDVDQADRKYLAGLSLRNTQELSTVQNILREIYGRAFAEQHRIDEVRFWPMHLRNIAFFQVACGRIGLDVANFVVSSLGPRRLDNFLTQTMEIYTDESYVRGLISLLNGSQDRHPGLALHIVEYAAAYSQLELGTEFGKVVAGVVSDKFGLRQAKIDLGTELFRLFSQQLGLQVDNISEDMINAWELSYLSKLFVGRKMIHAKGTAYRPLQDLFDSIITSTLEGRFEQFIMDTNPETNAYPMGVRVAEHNEQLRAALSEKGIDVAFWLRYSETSSFGFSAEEDEGEVIDIIGELGALADALSFILNKLPGDEARYGEAILGSLRKMEIFLDTTDPERPFFCRIMKDGELSTDPEDVLSVLFDGQRLPGLRKNLAYVQGRTVEQEVATAIFHFVEDIDRVDGIVAKTDLKDLTSGAERFTVKVWGRNPARDIFQGNFTSCCVAIDNNLHPEAILEYLIDQGIQVVEVINEATGETIAQTWCFIAMDGDGEAVLVMDNIEVVGKYAAAGTDENNIIRDNILSYLQRYTRAIGAKGLYLGNTPYQDVDVSTFERVPVSLTKLGGNLWAYEGEGQGYRYYLEALYSEDRSRRKTEAHRMSLPEVSVDETATDAGFSIEVITPDTIDWKLIGELAAVEVDAYAGPMVLGVESIRSVVENPKAVCLVIRDDSSGRIAGYRFAIPSQEYPQSPIVGADILYGYDIAIHPKYQRRGLFSRLHAEFIEEARARGYTAMSAHVRIAGNVPEPLRWPRIWIERLEGRPVKGGQIVFPDNGKRYSDSILLDCAIPWLDGESAIPCVLDLAETESPDVDLQGRDESGKFAELPMKSPGYMRDFVATHYGDSPFTIAQYIKDWETANPGRRLPSSTAYSDLTKARANGWIEKLEGPHYRLAEIGQVQNVGHVEAWEEDVSVAKEQVVKVLVLDDDYHMLNATKERLAASEIVSIETAAEMDEGLKILEANPDINFLVLDFRLFEYPTENGVQFCKKAFKAPYNFEGRVVIYSADDTAIISELKRYPDLWDRYIQGQISIQLKHDTRAFEDIRARIISFARGEEALPQESATDIVALEEELPLAALTITPDDIGITPAIVDRFRDCHVIIADDKPFIRNAIEATVSRFFDNVHKLGTVEDAVELVKALRRQGVPEERIIILSDYEFGTEQTGIRRLDGRDFVNMLRLAPNADYPEETLGFMGFFFFVSGSIISKDQISGFNKSAKDIDFEVKVKYGIDYIEKNADEEFPIALLKMVYVRLQKPYNLSADITDALPRKPMSKPADISFLNGGVNDFETRLKMGLRVLKDSLTELAPRVEDREALRRIEEVLSKMSAFFELGNVDRSLAFNVRTHNYKGHIFYAAGYLTPQIREEVESLSASDREKYGPFLEQLDNLSLTMNVAANYMLRLLRLSAAVGNINMPITFEEFIHNTVEIFLTDYGKRVSIETDFDRDSLEGLEFPYGLAFIVAFILDNALEQYQVKFGKDFKGKIFFKVNKEEKTLEIEIIDEAGGIPEKVLPNIFLRKFTTKVHGAGFGLFWAKQLMGMYDGEIAVRNEGDGACFTLTLPLDWKRIAEEKEYAPEELMQRVLDVLAERGNPDAEELAEKIAREIYTYSTKIAEVTKTRETISHESYLYQGHKHIRYKIEEMLNTYFLAICTGDYQVFRDIIFEKGTTQKDIEDLLLSLLALKQVEEKEDITFAHLPVRQAVVLLYDSEGRARILLRSKENLAREEEGITPEKRNRYQRVLRQTGYAIHKLGGDVGHMSSAFYFIHTDGKISEGKKDYLERLFRQDLPDEVYGMIHTYTSSGEQLSGFEDDILWIERVDGWLGAISDQARAFMNAKERLDQALEGVELEEGSTAEREVNRVRRIAETSQTLLKLLHGQQFEDKEVMDISVYPDEDSRVHGKEQFHFNVSPGTRLRLSYFFLDNIMLNLFRCKPKDEDFYVDVKEEGGYTVFNVRYKGQVDPETMFEPKESRSTPWQRYGPLIHDLIDAVNGEVTAQNVGEDVEIAIRFPLPDIDSQGTLLDARADLNKLKQTVVLFSGDEAQDNLGEFKLALGELDETNTAVVIVGSEEQQRFFVEHRGELGRFYIRTPEQIGLAGVDLNQVMTTIMGIDNLRCIPLTDSLLNANPSLKQARDQV
ncbi:GNAT family N-acetyltransferase [Candidatus Omnitrophota bacterium]